MKLKTEFKIEDGKLLFEINLHDVFSELEEYEREELEDTFLGQFPNKKH